MIKEVKIVSGLTFEKKEFEQEVEKICNGMQAKNLSVEIMYQLAGERHSVLIVGREKTEMLHAI